MAASLLPDRDPLSRRPDPASLLQAAIRERDAATTARLLHQWVHRRGLAALQRFRDELAITQGAEAGRWLEGLLEAPGISARAFTATASPAPAVADAPPALPVSFSDPLVVGPEATVSIDTGAIEAVASAGPAPIAEAPPLAEAPPVAATAPVAALADPPPALAADWSFDLEAAFPSSVSAGRPTAARFADPIAAPATPGLPEPEPIPAEAEGGGEEVHSPAPRRPFSPLARMKALMRDCLDEARGVFQRADHEPDPEDFPAVDETPGPAAPAAQEWPASSSPALSLPPTPSGAAPCRPAPAPTTLSDLRSWLPDSAGDLPKAS